MNKLVKFSLLFAMLASGACRAEQSICQPMCAQEKRVCRADAARLNDHQAAAFKRDRNPGALDIGNSNTVTGQMVGATAHSSQDRKLTRMNVCDDKYKVCAEACTVKKPVRSDVLIKPAAKE